MKSLAAVPVAALLISFGLLSATSKPGPTPPPPAPPPAPEQILTQKTPHNTMRAFASDQELAKYFQELRQKQKRARQEIQSFAGVPGMLDKSDTLSLASPSATRSVAADSVTNVQEAGVDEGGIVKVHGNHLVVLRRGRLFTVAIGDGALDPISNIDAFAPDIDPSSTWYDEMLISNNTIVVIGYSYERGGTEVGLFHIDEAGKLSYRSTYHLRSNDYYSSRNYASRLIGTKLIFYSPLYFYPGEDPFQSFPAVRKWHKGATKGEFHRIASATNVYRPARETDLTYGSALHTVTVCDLANGFDCHATSVVGPAGRVFYVSPESVYVWVTDWANRYKNEGKMRSQSTIYRMPLDGSAPTALGVSGSPVDQFSFLESRDANDRDGGQLNVLVRSDAAGDGMWGAEVAAGDVALLRVPLTCFSDGSQTAPATSYRRLPAPQGYTFQNRFVGNDLLYGTGSGWSYPEKAKRKSLYIVPWAGGAVSELSLSHGVDRIEELGSNAVVVGSDGKDLHFSAVRLGDSPKVADEYVRKGASQGELRSQGFFYKPDAEDSGMLGLPISTPARPGYRHLFETSAAVLFLRNDSLRFEEAGELAAQYERATNDGCRASCVDWYGNARPLFVRGRVLALLGYELVEGTLNRGHMRELRRVNYAPTSLRAYRLDLED